MSIFAKAKRAREDKKGFTLVELIVVLVILAILAAMLVPALLGWIDEARNKQFVLEARNVLMATQAYVDEQYLTGNTPAVNTALDAIALTRIKKISDADFASIEITKYGARSAGADASAVKAEIAAIEIDGLVVGNQKTKATLTENGEWSIDPPTPYTPEASGSDGGGGGGSSSVGG